ncbi:MAG: CPBP family intramembrane glutamic endopeptidase [Spirochaetota bacterium]
MKGYIKAAYIYWLLPQPAKSRCLTALDSQQQAKLNKGLQHITSLSIQQEITILKEAIHKINAIQIHTRHIRDISIIASCIILGIIVILSIIISPRWHVIQSIYYILQYGGLHAVLMPFIVMYASTLTGKSLFQLIMPSQIVIDILMSIIGATAIIIVYFLIFPHNTALVTKQSIIAFVFAITAVPLSEELFFRGIIYLHGGKLYGYTASWFFASFVFATIHLPHTPQEFAAYFIFSTILCGIVYRFSLFSSIVAHALSNGLLFLL